MAAQVTLETSEYASGAFRFEAGSPNVAGPVAWAAGLEFIRALGWERCRTHLRNMAGYCARRLADVKRVRLVGAESVSDRVGIFSFVVEARNQRGPLRLWTRRELRFARVISRQRPCCDASVRNEQCVSPLQLPTIRTTSTN